MGFSWGRRSPCASWESTVQRPTLGSDSRWRRLSSDTHGAPWLPLKRASNCSFDCTDFTGGLGCAGLAWPGPAPGGALDVGSL